MSEKKNEGGDRMALLKKRADLQRERPHEERERLNGRYRVRGAMDRCKVGNFDDLDFLLKIVPGGYVRNVDDTVPPELIIYMREFAGVTDNSSLRAQLDNWKTDRDRKRGSK